MAQALASIMSESGRLGNRPAHGDGSWIVRPRIGARSGAGPIGETVASGSGSTNRDNRSIIFPPASWGNSPTCAGSHGQIILLREVRRVCLVDGGSHSARNSFNRHRPIGVTPITPHVLNPGPATLWRSCCNSVARTWRPGKGLRCGVGSAVNCEAPTSDIGLDGYLNWILSKSSYLRNRPTHGDGGRAVRTGVGACAGPSPSTETIAHLRVVRWRRAN